jgi:hypothetical protein
MRKSSILSPMGFDSPWGLEATRLYQLYALVVKLEITKPYEGLVPDSNSGKSANLLPLWMVFPTLVF